MKKLITLILTYIGQALMASWMIVFLCSMIIQEASAKVHTHVTFTWWNWKTRFRWFKRKLSRFKTKVWNFLKNMQWSWIVIAYLITLAANIGFKDWIYVDYIWIIPFILMLGAMALSVIYPEKEENTKPDIH